MAETWLKLDRGLISVDDAITEIKKKYPEEIDMINIFFTHWWDLFTPIERNVKILKKLKSNGYKLYILSNYMLEPSEHVIKKYDFFKCFDGAVYSYQIHHIKPEIEMYETLINRYNLNPEESLFLDDHFECLEPARKLGMKIIEVKPNTEIEKELGKLGIQINDP